MDPFNDVESFKVNLVRIAGLFHEKIDAGVAECGFDLGTANGFRFGEQIGVDHKHLIACLR